MPVLVSMNGGKKALCPEGTLDCRLAAVYDLYKQPGYRGGDPCRKLALIFETDLTIQEGALAGKKHLINVIATDVWSENSKLYEVVRGLAPDLKSQDMTDGSLDLEGLIGFPCRAEVQHTNGNGNGKTTAKAVKFMPHPSAGQHTTPEFNAELTPTWIANMQAQRLDQDATTENGAVVETESTCLF